MKRFSIKNLGYILFILFSFFGFSESIAQKKQGFSAGISAGLVASQVDGDRYSGYQRLGMQGGIFSSFTIGEDMFGKIEIKYMQKGSKRVDQKNGVYFELKLQYIEVPVLAGYQIDEKFSVEAGPGLGYLIKAEEDRDGAGFTEADPAFESYEICGILGLNYELNDNIIANVKASYSMLPVRPHPGNQTYYMDKGNYNNLICASVYYRF
ncbi:MAG: outer membrane beta-barrel protein [Bacteroidota bacterium]